MKSTTDVFTLKKFSKDIKKIVRYDNKVFITVATQQFQWTVLISVTALRLPKCLFTWREGALANRATQLEGLKHSPALHVTHLTGSTVSRLRELSFEWPLSTTSITVHEGNFFLSYFSFLNGHRPVLCLRLVDYTLHWSLQIDCHSVQQMTLTNGNYKNIHFAPPCFRSLSHLC